ncbi:alpha/beta fold hydrolase [Pseudarthrobacter scleromae]|uniref:alpha/beta fold hydrolase n=1 Tax=Pseudarthrobacter scleromae TaxID=158897 RepID=UPI003D061E95
MHDDERQLRFRVTGTGAPVLLLHGIGRSHADWGDQHERLSASHQVWSLDLPGFGDSPPPAERPRLPLLASAVSDFLAGQNLGPVHIAGNSLGGAVAMQIAADRPEQVRSLLLANSAGFGRSVGMALRLATVPGLGEMLMRPNPAAAKILEKALYHDHSFATPERIKLAFDLASRPGSNQYFLDLLRSLGTIGGIKSTWRRQLLKRVAATGLPVLVVWGTKDRILPVSHVLGASRIADARVQLFADTGHLPQIERADDFARTALEFWSGQDAQDIEPSQALTTKGTTS